MLKQFFIDVAVIILIFMFFVCSSSKPRVYIETNSWDIWTDTISHQNKDTANTIK